MSALLVVLPIFALVFAGWLARRIGVLGANATTELNRFVVYLALPALLFDIVANAQWQKIWQSDFILAFGLGAGAVFAVTIVLRLRGRHLADAAIDGLSAGYANIGFMGFPLVVAVMGTAALATTLIATIVTVCVLFALALILVEIGLQTERHPARLARKVALSLARNPLLVAPLLGIVFLFGPKIPGPIEAFLKLLGAAASPCALVALGLFLADKRRGHAPWTGVASLVGLKLLAQPLLTWLAAVYLAHLPYTETRLAVLLAALPTGTGPFMVAEFYDREAAVTAGAILFSTILSLVTISVYLAMT